MMSLFDIVTTLNVEVCVEYRNNGFLTQSEACSDAMLIHYHFLWSGRENGTHSNPQLNWLDTINL